MNVTNNGCTSLGSITGEHVLADSGEHVVSSTLESTFPPRPLTCEEKVELALNFRLFLTFVLR